MREGGNRDYSIDKSCVLVKLFRVDARYFREVGVSCVTQLTRVDIRASDAIAREKWRGDSRKDFFRRVRVCITKDREPAALFYGAASSDS